MFCKVTLTGDGRSQNTQLMRAVKAIATATAGSTPSVTGSTVYNNASTGQYEVITTVLDNTVAGGWTVKADQTTLSGAVVSTNAFLESLLLYNTTGKSALPYIWFSMIEGSYTAAFTLNTGPFVSFGYASSLANCNYGSGHNVTSNFTSTASQTIFSGCVNNPTANSQDYVKPMSIYNNSTRVYYISATAEYIHIQQDITTGTTTAGSWFHLGLRTNSSWEDNYNDNPYWVATWLVQGSVATSYTGSTADSGGYWTVMRPIDTSTGTVGAAVNILRMAGLNSTINVHPVTGYASTTTYLTPYHQQTAPPQCTYYLNYPTSYASAGTNGGTGYTMTTGVNGTTTGLQTNIYTSVFGWSSQAGVQAPNIGVTSDSSTNALICPALPMYIRLQGNTNYGGYLKNMFQSSTFGTAAELDLYHVIDASYTIDGSTFIGVRTGYYNSGTQPRQIIYVKAS